MSRHVETDSTRYAAFWGDEIVVALPHLHQVETVLRLAGVEWECLDTSEALDLARLEVPMGAGAAVEKYVTEREHAEVKPAGEHDRPVDRLLASLRAYFQHRHAGWSPTLGKNRLVGAVFGGGGAISHGGGGAPESVREATLPPRGAGPGRGVRVGVLDTGLAPQPWLAGGWEAGYSDRLREQRPYRAAAGHATFVTGLILSQAPGATVVVRKVLAADRNGEYVADCWTVATAMVELGTSGVDVLNLSLVCYTEDGEPPLLLSTAMSRLDPHVVVVAAAGNHGDMERRCPERAREKNEISKATWPAALPGVIAVGAAAVDGEPASFTPPDKYWIDLLAPGENVVSTYLDGKVTLDDGEPEDFSGLARWSGSSFAAALLSGAIAAGVQPGRVSARESLKDILRSAAGDPDAELPDYTPPFVPLELLEPEHGKGG